MTAHAKLSASGAHRWMTCPGSVAAEDGLRDYGSTYSHEGTSAHALAEACLKNGSDPFSYVGKIAPNCKDVEVDQEMANGVRYYMDYLAEVPGVHAYECQVRYDRWVFGGFGTADCISLDRGTLYVVDLKYGKGLRVDADANHQLMLYALGAYDEREHLEDVDTVKLVIVQPRLDHISEWSCSVDDLLAFGESARAAAQIALRDDAKRVPGEAQCQFCKAKATCPALLDYTHQIIGRDFDKLTEVDRLSADQISQVLSAKTLITDWLKSVEQYVTDKLHSGEPFPGWKLVQGRSLRAWSDDFEAEQTLYAMIGEECYEKKLLSPAKAEKVVGKALAKDLAELIVKPEGKPTLAPESDKRPAIQVKGGDFENLTQH